MNYIKKNNPSPHGQNTTIRLNDGILTTRLKQEMFRCFAAFLVSIMFFVENVTAIDLFPENCNRGTFGASFDVSFDTSDAFIGGTVYFKYKKFFLDEALVLSALWRPRPDELVEKVSDKTYYIYHHEFFSIQTGVEQQVHLTPGIKLFITPMIGFFKINRRGSKSDMGGIAAPVLHIGLGYRFGTLDQDETPSMQVRMGYQLIRSDDYDSDKFLISLFFSQ